MISAESVKNVIKVRRLTFTRDRFESPRFTGSAVDYHRRLAADQVAIIASNIHFSTIGVLAVADCARTAGQVDSAASSHYTTFTF